MECRSIRSGWLVLFAAILFFLHAPATAYTMWSTAASYLGTGELQGPGLGPGSPQPLFCMNIRHLMFTTYTDLVVPFENQGTERPDIVGKSQIPGDPDGRLSDGSLINENVNTCAAVIAGRRVLPAVVQGGMHTGQVFASTTSDGVFTMSMDLAIDLTDGHTVKLPLYGTVGEVTVPQSLQTQMGSKGVDQAGEYPSGTRLQGRIGDFNHDGWIDGTLVFVGVIPLDSPIASGQPFVLVRNFETDIPVAGEWSGDVKSLKVTHRSLHRNSRQPASVARLPYSAWGDSMFNFIHAAAGRRLGLTLAVGLIAIVCAGRTSAATYEIEIGLRQLYGPGPFPDEQLGTGHVRSMDFRSFMTATVPAFNNGPAEPNVSGEAAQGSPVDGKLSDGTLINENIDMGNAVILNGQFNLLLGAVFGGPSKGNSHFYLDDAYNWTIHDDIAMDPGFPEGIVKINDFVFSTGPRQVPLSIQTEKHYPGGVDRVGSLQSGDLVVGRLGDDDFDGRVDGVFFAMGQLPLTSPFLPGAPFVQRMEFTSTIPISGLEAALLSVATGRNCLRALGSATAGPRPERDRAALTSCVQERERVAMTHLQHVREKGVTCAPNCAEVSKVAQELADAQRLGIAEGSRQAAVQLLDEAVASLVALRPPCAYCR